MNDSNNYRGIPLSSILSKLVDIILISKYRVHLESSDLQFGFKQKSSTVQCSFLTQEIINYYCNNDGNLYSTFLDASKAFDRVRFDCLFELLLARNLCPVAARLLAYMYTNQLCRIKWCNSVSDSFSVKNGVKQGGVLSPLLFNIYLDVLLVRLKKSNLGCHFGSLYMGSLAYADDVVLLCPTLYSLKEMLKICEQFSTEFNIEFNASKTKLIVFGNCPLQAAVTFQGKVISKVDREKHVGIFIGTDKNIGKTTISKACGDMYARFNLLLRQFGSCSPNVLYRLFNNYCMSFYGCQLWDFENVRLLENVFVSWRKCIRKLLGVPYNTHCNLLHLLCKDSSVQVKLHKRFLRFFIGLRESDNVSLSLMYSYVLSGNRSKTCNSINYLCYKYGINKQRLSVRDLSLVKDHDDEKDITKATIITDFMDLNLYSSDNGNISEIINHLCTC